MKNFTNNSVTCNIYFYFIQSNISKVYTEVKTAPRVHDWRKISFLTVLH